MKNGKNQNETMAPKWEQMGRRMCQNRGFLFSEKRFSRFWGVQHAIFDANGCPKIGVSYFRKKGFRVLGTWRKMSDAHFGAFLFF